MSITEETRELMIQNISEFLNDKGIYKLIQDEATLRGIDIHHDSDKWREMEEAIVDTLISE